MAEANTNNESRDDILHVPNLFEFFCQLTARDMRSRGSDDAPATSFAGLIIALLVTVSLYLIGRPELAKATFILVGLIIAWMVWGAIVRASEQISQKASSILAGVFPPESAPFVLARLKWWNHLVAPRRWGRHSRLYDRRGKLERKIEEMQRRVAEAIANAGSGGQNYSPPTDAEVFELAGKINKYSNRSDYENGIAALSDPIKRLRAESLLYMALLHKLNEMADRLDRIEKLSVVFQNVTPNDLSQVVGEAIQVLEERRLLVLSVDNTDPDSFIDLVTVRSS